MRSLGRRARALLFAPPVSVVTTILILLFFQKADLYGILFCIAGGTLLCYAVTFSIGLIYIRFIERYRFNGILFYLLGALLLADFFGTAFFELTASYDDPPVTLRTIKGFLFTGVLWGTISYFLMHGRLYFLRVRKIER